MLSNMGGKLPGRWVGQAPAKRESRAAEPGRGLEACLAVLGQAPVIAVELFFSACSGPDAMLGGQRLGRFFRYALHQHHGSLEPLLQRMAASPVPAASSMGAVWLTVQALHGQCAWESATELSLGTPAERKGVATAAAHNCADAVFAERCAALLGGLIDDPDEGVREEAVKFLLAPAVLRTPAGRGLAARFAASKKFARHSSWLAHAIRGCPDSLIPLTPVFEAVCDRGLATLVAPLGSEPRAFFAMDEFVPLLLRLYEQAEQQADSSLRGKCLDWWDLLLEVRMGGSLQLTGDLDAAVLSG